MASFSPHYDAMPQRHWVYPSTGTGTAQPIIRPLPQNFPSHIRRARLCDERASCKGPYYCTFAHNQHEVEAWNRQLQMRGTCSYTVIYMFRSQTRFIFAQNTSWIKYSYNYVVFVHILYVHGLTIQPHDCHSLDIYTATNTNTLPEVYLCR